MRGILPPRQFTLTGPTGWIGQAMLTHLAARFDAPLAQYVTLFGSVGREITAPNGERLEVRALSTLCAQHVADRYLVHLAYLTKEKADALGEASFRQINEGIDTTVLSAMSAGVPASVFVASSGAAQLVEQQGDRHPYGIAKLEQEQRFLAFGRTAGVPTFVGRIFNLAGPHVNKLEAYAISNFAQQARRAGAIAIDADRPVFRSYLHVDDLCDLIVTAAQQGTTRAAPIDLCGSTVVEMQEVANAVAAVCGGGILIRRGSVDCSRPSAYLGNPVDVLALAMELGIGLRAFDEQISNTVAWMDDVAGAKQQFSEHPSSERSDGETSVETQH